MSNLFSAIITPRSIAFSVPSGKMYNITDAHANYEKLKGVIKELQGLLKTDVGPMNDPEMAAAYDTEHQDSIDAKFAELIDLAEPINIFKNEALVNGEVTVNDGIVYYGGEPMHNAITDRILWGISEGFDMKSYMLFLKNLMSNPSKRAVDELYEFIEKYKMGITDDGFILAYKRVKDDFMDIFTGKHDNHPGKILEMPRNKVDDDKDRTCSHGYHFCAMDYLPHYGSGPGNKVVIVKVNPMDVVSIPADYNAAKARTCRYEVLSEYTGSDLADILSTKAIWATSEWTGEDDEDADRGFDHDDDEDDHDGNDPEDNIYDQELDGAIRDDVSIKSVIIYLDYLKKPTSIDITWADDITSTTNDEFEMEQVSDLLSEQADDGFKAKVKYVDMDEQ